MGDGGVWDLPAAIRRQWRLVLLVALPLLVGGVAYAESLPAQYEAEAVVGFAPRDDTTGADILRLLLPRFSAFVSAPETVERLAPDAGARRGAVSACLDATVPPETANLVVSCRHRSPATASRVANTFAEAAVELADGDTVVSASVVTRALVPDSPSGPPRRLLEVAVAIVALAAGALTALLAERDHPRVRSLTDLSTVVDARVLGYIPTSRGVRQNPVAALSDRSIGVSVRSLRTAFQRAVGDRSNFAVAVTSAGQGEGKSTVSALLALALASLDQRVLLVDLDLVRPQLAARFGVPAEPGLLDVLRHTDPASGALPTATLAHGLHLLPTRFEPDAADLLARRLPDLLGRLRSQYDVVVIDGPPLLGSDLSRTIASACDGTLLVIRAGTATGSVHEAVSVLQTLHAELLGVIGDGFLAGGPDYYSGVRR